MNLPALRVGHGYDVHRLTEGRPLILGGVPIPYERGLDGHSDADVLVHAVMDAVLGAMGLGDIGGHFPDTDESYRGIDSMLLCERVATLMTERGWLLMNVDATIIAQRPKLAPYLPQMKERIATVFSLSPDRINLKATTEERLGFTGRGEGISAHAVCLLVRPET